MNPNGRVDSLSELDNLSDRCRKEIQRRGQVRQVLIHMGTCGIASGSESVKSFLHGHFQDQEERIALLETGCYGACHLEPMITVIESDGARTVYGNLNQQKLERIYSDHLLGGDVVLDLVEDLNHPFYQKQVKRVTELLGLIDPCNIRDYLGRGGYSGLARALSMEPGEVIQEIKNSGLRGRGGAGFPTGLKWSFAAQASGDSKYVVCNADEGDPGAYMDRAIIEGNPHLVIEGLAIAAHSIGANKGYVYIRAEYPLAVRILDKAIEQARRVGLLGRDIAGSGFNFDIEIYLGAGAFVCGEETALIASIEGKRGNPRPKPPYPANNGLFGKPTNVNNVKTLSNVSLILRKGADWFTQVGTEKSKGTKIFSITGKIRRTGLIEVPLGITLKEVIFEIGGGIPGDREFKAVQLGGPSGGCIPAKYVETPIDYVEIEALGAIMGSGGMIVMDEDSCMPDIARFFTEFTQQESCGKCTPCRAGIPPMLRILKGILDGKGSMEDLGQLEYLGEMIKESSLCGLGQTAPNPVLSTIRHFRQEYVDLIRSGKRVARQRTVRDGEWVFG